MRQLQALNTNPKWSVKTFTLKVGNIIYFNEKSLHAAVNLGDFNVSVMGLVVKESSKTEWISEVKNLKDNSSDVFQDYKPYVEPFVDVKEI